MALPLQSIKKLQYKKAFLAFCTVKLSFQIRKAHTQNVFLLKKYAQPSGSLSAPNFLSDLLNELELVPLFFLCELITDLTGSESALWAQVESVERYILGSLTDPVDNDLLILKNRRLGCDKTKNDLLVR